jgi:hypothetical protein
MEVGSSPLLWFVFVVMFSCSCIERKLDIFYLRVAKRHEKKSSKLADSMHFDVMRKECLHIVHPSIFQGMGKHLRIGTLPSFLDSST